MRRPGPSTVVSLLLGLCLVSPRAGATPRSAYPDGRELMGRLLTLARDDRGAVAEIGFSAGGQKLRMITIEPAVATPDPATVLVVGDPGGTDPLASLTAVDLAAAVFAAREGPAAAVRWAILPLADPDGYDRFFARPRLVDGRNRTAVDDDRDGAEGEDPPDDLDGDGLVTTMLVADPTGTWLVDPVTQLPREAASARGERGRYRREIEGRDDDGDGLANEDAPGGVVPDRNFPHRFAAWTDAGGRWPADQPESRAVLTYAFAHPEIALVIVLGAHDNLRTVPAPDPSPPSGHQPVMLPPRVAAALSLDRKTAYPLDFVLAAAREARVPDYPPQRVRGLLDLGPREYPDPGDLVWWHEASSSYQQALRTAGLAGPSLGTPALPPGSVAEWAYYQFGVPAFAVNPWSCPLPDSTALDSTLTPAQNEMAALRSFAARHGGAGWRPWQDVTLPDGTSALVGGPEPGARRTPPPALADSIVAAQLPALLDLARWRPVLGDVTVQVEPLAAGTFAVTAFVANDGPVPYPTAQGAVCRRPPPLVVTLTGATPLATTARRTVVQLPAHDAARVRWVVRGEPGARVSVTASAPSLGEATGIAALTRTGEKR